MKGKRLDKERDITILAISNFLHDKGGEWDWDDYTGTRMKTLEMELIRKAALFVDLPLDNEGREMLESLLAQAQRL